MRTALYALAAVALGLLVPVAARACDYNKVAVANVVAVNQAVAVQTVAVPVQAVVAVPTVNSFLVATPVFVQQKVKIVAVNGYGQVRNVRGGRNEGSGVVGIARASARTVGNVAGAVIGR